jgi:hypothetical protein
LLAAAEITEEDLSKLRSMGYKANTVEDALDITEAKIECKDIVHIRGLRNLKALSVSCE